MEDELLDATKHLTRTVSDTKRLVNRRQQWLSQALSGRDGWTCDGVIRFFGGGRRCVCGHTVYNALVLRKKGLPDVHLGTTCALSAFGYITGGADVIQQLPDERSAA